MIRRTPFHDRFEPLNATGLWGHWSAHLAATKYQMAEKFEYLAIRNAVAVIDTSPLYKYRITGPDAERFLAGVMARDIRSCKVGQAQYTVWLDDDGWVVEDGVVFRHAADDYLLTCAEPNLSYFDGLARGYRVTIEDVSEQWASLSVQGPRSRAVLADVAPEVTDLRFFHHTPAKIAGASVWISRTGYTGDLGYEVWVESADAGRVFDAVMEAGERHRIVPAGMQALLMSRIEAGLVLIPIDFQSSRFAFTDEQRSTPLELGMRWMFRGLVEGTDQRSFVGGRALRREIAEGTSRWAWVGLTVDPADWQRRYEAAGLYPPADHTPVLWEMMLYDDDMARVGYTTSFMYSPMLQCHIAMARVRPHLGAPGSQVHLEVTIDHRYQTVLAHVHRPPLFNPARKTA
jgi:aminomethyltransferase